MMIIEEMKLIQTRGLKFATPIREELSGTNSTVVLERLDRTMSERAGLLVGNRHCPLHHPIVVLVRARHVPVSEGVILLHERTFAVPFLAAYIRDGRYTKCNANGVQML